MTPPVLTISNRIPDPVRESYYKLPEFLESCRRQNFFPIFLGGEPRPGIRNQLYRGLMSKPRLLLDWIEASGAKHEHLIVCDSWDVIFCAGPDEVLYNWNIFGAPIVFNAETNCFPKSDLAWKHPPSPTKYKYLNSGFFVGNTEAIRQMLLWMKERTQFPDDVQKPDGSWVTPNDQQFYMEYFVEAGMPSIRLDHTGILCASLHDADEREYAFLPDKKRVVSLETRNEPCVLHGNGNGKRWLERIIKWMGL